MKTRFIIPLVIISMIAVIPLWGCINVYPDGREGGMEEPQPGEPEAEMHDTVLPIVEGECGTYLENYNQPHQQGDYIFAGDSTSGSISKGYVSFNISSILGSQVHFARLDLKCKNKSNDPSFFGEFIIFSAKNWGARPLKGGDFNREDFEIGRYPSSGGGSSSIEGPGLADAIQDNVNSNNDRFQIIISPQAVPQNDPGRTNSNSDGFLYYVADLELFIEYSK